MAEWEPLLDGGIMEYLMAGCSMHLVLSKPAMVTTRERLLISVQIEALPLATPWQGTLMELTSIRTISVQFPS